jgi:S-methyl-5-thioribose-1-phosphate isomerase
VRTIDWADDAVQIIDQTALPGRLRVLTLATVDELVDAIRRLAIRGAPALGAAGALGVALAAVGSDGDRDRVRAAAELLRGARPTAVNLGWGVDRALRVLDLGADAVLAEALAVLDEDGDTNRRIGQQGAAMLAEMGLDRVSALTHCNAGSLACVEWGTALGVLRQLHAEGRLVRAIATETRPLLQGARLTAWELSTLGVPYELIVDSAAASVLARHVVDVVVVGADRVAANGDVANKIGTLPIALAAAYAGTPFVVAAPESTIDPASPDGAAIDIEHRSPDEVTSWQGRPLAPPGTSALNPAFDVTPGHLITAIVTEKRVIRPADGRGPSAASDPGRALTGPGRKPRPPRTGSVADA